MRLFDGNSDKWDVALIGRNLTNELIAGSANDQTGTGLGTGTATGVLADTALLYITGGSNTNGVPTSPSLYELADVQRDVQGFRVDIRDPDPAWNTVGPIPMVLGARASARRRAPPWHQRAPRWRGG